jgi:uncharacterized protein (TIGR03085 family)
VVRAGYHHVVSFARDERAALCALLEKTGPAAPTLCEGWRTLDLAAHLVLREHHPAAAAGLVISPLARRTERVQRTLMERIPFSQLIATIRNGPPRLSVYRIPGFDERANTAEFFVHHEDVRRAASGWEPRDLPPGLANLLWQQLRLARLLLRKAPVGVELARDDVGGSPGPERVRITAKARAPVVTVTGPPAELLLWVMGRTSAARVRMDGSTADIGKLTDPRWRRR